MHSTWKYKQPFGFAFKLLLSLFLLAAIPLVVLTVWINQALSAPSGEAKEKIFVINKGETAASFANRLEEEGVIKDAFVFRIYLKLTGLDTKIQAGSYRLATSKDVSEIASLLTTGKIDQWLTVIEGLRKEEVAEKITSEFKIDKENFLSNASEGYLFPDTYLIPVSANEDQILAIFEKNFNKRFSEQLAADAAKAGLTRKEVIILASIVERESKVGDERPIIAGILLKRWRQGMRLAADATTQYALGYSKEEKTWWRKTLTEQDLKIDSLYNTRLKVGLPPEPICSPGLSAIRSVIYPTTSDYYFYIHDKEGKAHFAKTFEEHQQNIAKYLR